MKSFRRKDQKAAKSKSHMNFQSHSQDSGFYSKHATKSFEGFEQECKDL